MKRGISATLRELFVQLPNIKVSINNLDLSMRCVCVEGLHAAMGKCLVSLA